MSTGKGLAILLAVVVVAATYIALATWIGIKDYWVGFLLLTQWTVVDGGKLGQLPRTVAGALSGMVLALIPVLLSAQIGSTPALAIMLALMLIAIFLFITMRATYVVNAATMIFLTVLTVPEIAPNTTPAALFAGFALGLVFFGGLALLGSVIAKGQASKAPATSPEPSGA
ncbi:MAG TPA: hypothetical protein VJ762_14760 [Sphingobium sp.]|nr:hypothetical protein [Sphingobium sp.]